MASLFDIRLDISKKNAKNILAGISLAEDALSAALSDPMAYGKVPVPVVISDKAQTSFVNTADGTVTISVALVKKMGGGSPVGEALAAAWNVAHEVGHVLFDANSVHRYLVKAVLKRCSNADPQTVSRTAGAVVNVLQDYLCNQLGQVAASAVAGLIEIASGRPAAGKLKRVVKEAEELGLILPTGGPDVAVKYLSPLFSVIGAEGWQDKIREAVDAVLGRGPYAPLDAVERQRRAAELVAEAVSCERLRSRGREAEEAAKTMDLEDLGGEGGEDEGCDCRGGKKRVGGVRVSKEERSRAVKEFLERLERGELEEEGGGRGSSKERESSGEEEKGIGTEEGGGLGSVETLPPPPNPPMDMRRLVSNILSRLRLRKKRIVVGLAEGEPIPVMAWGRQRGKKLGFYDYKRSGGLAVVALLDVSGSMIDSIQWAAPLVASLASALRPDWTAVAVFDIHAALAGEWSGRVSKDEILEALKRAMERVGGGGSDPRRALKLAKEAVERSGVKEAVIVLISDLFLEPAEKELAELIRSLHRAHVVMLTISPADQDWFRKHSRALRLAKSVEIYRVYAERGRVVFKPAPDDEILARSG